MEQHELDELKEKYEDILEAWFNENIGHQYNNGEGWDEAISNWYEELTESEINVIVSQHTINKLKK